MDVIAKWGSTIIVLINTIFGAVALLFLAIGIMVKYAADKVDSLADSVLSMAKDKIPEQATKYLDIDNLKVSEFVGEAYIAFVATGSVLLCVVIWAYCGTCCKSRWMLSIYALILTLVILGQVAVVILFTTNRALIDNAIKDAMKETLKFYKGGFGKDAPSKAWNAIMGLLHCCGVNGVGDFTYLTGWTRVVTMNTSGSDLPQNITMDAPFLCCKNQSSTCPDQSFNNTNEYNGGCYDALWDMIASNKSMAIGVASGVGLFEVAMWFLTVWLIKSLGKKSKQVAPQ